MIKTLEWWAATSSIDRRTCSAQADTPTIRWIAVSVRGSLAVDAMPELVAPLHEPRPNGQNLPAGTARRTGLRHPSAPWSPENPHEPRP
jgi:hypothetical protein